MSGHIKILYEQFVARNTTFLVGLRKYAFLTYLGEKDAITSNRKVDKSRSKCHIYV